MYTKQQFKEELKKLIQEDSTSAGAGAYLTKPAFGKAKNYYLKMGYKLVDRAKLRKQQKSTDYKDLWK
jgi:hypothetical protein